MLVDVALLKTTPKAERGLVFNKIRELGGKLRPISDRVKNYPLEIYCWLPYDIVKEIAKLPHVGNISTIGFWKTRTGSVTTIGDTQLQASQARSYFDCDGTGITVGVISTGIEHAGESQLSGDLPSLQSIEGNTLGDEGTAMLEIVYDIAPGVSLAFGGIGENDGPSDMAQRIFDLYHNLSCKIVVDDICYYANIPLFSTDSITQKIEYELGNHSGWVYVSAAGNDFHNCYYCEQPSFDAYDKHKFSSTNNVYNSFLLEYGQSVNIVLQWANEWGNAPENYDLFLLDNLLTVVDSSTIVQNGSGFDPEEIISYTNSTGSTQTFFIRIDRVSAANMRPLKLIAVCPDSNYPAIELEYTYYNGEASAPYEQIYGHPASNYAISVAAYDADDPDEIADYSSRGPTTTYILSGATISSTIERDTPTITATAGCSTKVGESIYFGNPFYGTSAAAPHIAGIAALYFDEYPNDLNSDFLYALKNFADTLGTTGSGGNWNKISGYGKANAFATIAKGNFINVTVSQVDAQSQAFGQFGVYETNDWAYHSAPHTFSWIENQSQILQAYQDFKPSTTQKYHDWNELADVVNHNTFTIKSYTPYLTAHFVNAVNVTLQSQLIEGGAPDGTVDFKDPWLIDDTSAPKGSRNRGMNAIWHSQSSPFTPGTGSSYKGVFLNQVYDPQKSYYSVRVPETQTINGFTSYFQYWETNNANITEPNNLVDGYYESPVVFHSAGATVTARYKAHLRAGATDATAYNNGRRMIRAGTTLHLVYEDYGEIYYTYSTDDGASWAGEQLISHGTGHAKHPSIGYDIQGLHVVWERDDDRCVYWRKKSTNWGSIENVSYISASNYLYPAIATFLTGSFRVIFYHWDDGIYYCTRSSSYWTAPAKVPGTNSNSTFPSAHLGGPWGLAREEGGEIYYRQFWLYYDTIQWGTKIQISPAYLNYCHHPCTILDYTGYNYYTLAR